LQRPFAPRRGSALPRTRPRVPSPLAGFGHPGLSGLRPFGTLLVASSYKCTCPIVHERGKVIEEVRYVHVLGRLKRGVTEAQAELDLKPIGVTRLKIEN